MDDVMNLPRGGESVVTAGSSGDQPTKPPSQHQPQQPKQYSRHSSVTGVSKDVGKKREHDVARAKVRLHLAPYA